MATAMTTVSRGAIARLAMALMGLGLWTAEAARLDRRPSYVDVRRAADEAVRQWGAWE